MKFQDAVFKLLPFIDGVYDRYDVQAKPLETNSKITCSKGCGACCSFPLIPATAGEAFVVIARFLANGSSWKQLQDRFLPYAETYLNYARSQGSLPFTHAQQREFVKLGVSCPLFQTELAELRSGKCTIYGARPMICSYFNSVESPSLCLSKKPHGVLQNIVSLGEAAVEELRDYERIHFGCSAFGHFPLLLAALVLPKGLEVFLHPTIQDDEDLAWNDFQHYLKLISVLGYNVTGGDLRSLAFAQRERQE